MAGMTRLILLAMLVALASAKYKLMPYPGDCTSFYSCTSTKCPDDWIFDPTALACYPPSSMNRQVNLPQGQTIIIPDPDDNTIYWTCTRMPCPVGLEFNPIKLECEDPRFAGCRH